jgi:pantoate--beta-alanine ligase
VQTIRDLASLNTAIGDFARAGERVALVPTMGALHAGHMALVRAAREQAQADRVIVSIFVNPKQFGPNEDLDAYPRREATDLRMLADGGVDIAWLPDVPTMYPDGFATTIRVSGITDRLDGAHRPGHFDGVATVVTKLFNQVQPHVALFGEKDFQQLAVIRRLVADLNLPVQIMGIPTQRDDDGLALSSRNLYLTPEERTAALALPRALGVAQRQIEAGADVAATLAAARDQMERAGFVIDYVALVDADSLDEAGHGERRLLAAARIGSTRLIDNVAVAAAG